MTTITSYAEITFSTAVKRALKAQLKTIGHNLHQLRLARNEDIGTVAHAVAITPAQLAKIEEGRLNFRLGILFDLCDYFDANLEDIVK